MIMKVMQSHMRQPWKRGFSLVEALIAAGIVGVTLVGLYSGIAYSFQVIQLARENFRATQILLDRTETIRLYSWDQVNTPNFIPTTFEEPFYVTNAPPESCGLIYQGKVTISPVSSTASYHTNLRMVKFELTWNSGPVERKREMTTMISRDGLQNYIF